MDVHHLAFLARQPSAVLQSRESFLGMPKRGLAFLLANAIFWQPLLVQADGIVVSRPGTSLGAAGNGVPIVNIAAPNNSGLSHNQFKDFNVGAAGVILNNATGRTQPTQLGGIILGNPNLKGNAANIILNEVNGASPSQLRGYTEVAGQAAKVIVANPHGITCNGCGFINTPNVTLTTGKPMLGNGHLVRYQVDGGAVTIDGQGLNASNIDRFEIITRSAKINAQINARHLAVIAGRNDVNAKTLNAKVRTEDSSAKPKLAIDSSALGGMYAGAIKLVGTEKGVGVKLDGNLAASGGDIQLDANGHLSMAQASASSAINVKAESFDAQGAVYAGTRLEVQTVTGLSNQKSLAARDSLALSSGGQLTNNGIIEAGVSADNTRTKTGDISLSSATLKNTNSVVASRGLTVTTAQTLDNQAGTLSGLKIQVTADQFDNRRGRVLSTDTLMINAARLDNRANGLLHSNNNADISVLTALDNQSGRVMSLKDLRLNAGHLSNQSGEVSATQTRVTASTLDNRSGKLFGSNLVVTASDALINHRGLVIAEGALTLSAASVDNSQEGVISSKADTYAELGHLDNRSSGKLSSDGLLVIKANQIESGAGHISAKGGIHATVGVFNQQGGELVSEGALTLKSVTLDNRNAGLITADKGVDLHSQTVLNQQGEISSQAKVLLTADRLNNQEGKVISGDSLQLRVASALDNSLKGVLSAQRVLQIEAARLDNQMGGSLASHGALAITAGDVDNRGGVIGSQQVLNLITANLENSAGLISSQDDLTLLGQRVDSSFGGEVSAKGDMRLTVQQLIQRQGRLIGERAVAIDLQGGNLDNRAGLISAKGPLTFARLAALNNREQGEISSQRAFTIAAKHIDNSGRGIILSTDQLRLEAEHVLNVDKGLISGWNGLTVIGDNLDNSRKGTLTSHNDLVIKILAGDVNNQQDGLIFSQTGRLNLAARTLSNQSGTLQSQEDSRLRLSGALNNQGGRVDSLNGNLDLDTASVANNTGGVIHSNKGWIKFVTGLFDNSGGTTQAQSLSIHAKGGLLNQLGHLSALGGENSIVTSTLKNQGGGIYADNRLNLAAEHFDNQGQAEGSGGNVGARHIDIGLTGTLSNRFGLIESDETFRLAARDIHNVSGNLRAKGRSGTTDINASGLFDNRSGTLESANEQLNLRAAWLDNNDGQIVHTGSGKFDLTSDQVTRAGGSFVTNGQLDINAANWINSSVIQAGRLNLNIGQLTQTPSGQLLGLQRLSGKGVTWINEGLLASDGSLDLTLTSGYRGNGRISSLGDMTLTSVNLNLGDGARIAGGGISQIKSKTLNNRGRLTAVGDLSINTTTLNNYGTLGGAAKVRLKATHLLNDKGLLFSGNNMTLRVNNFSNRFGDVYSLGGLDIARNDMKRRSGLIENVSGTLESTGNMRLLGDRLSNRRDQFSAEKKLVSGNLNIYSNDSCKGKGCELYFKSVEKYEDAITGSSASAFINAGGDLTVGSKTFDNLYSSVSASKKILINTGVLNNTGAAGGEERHLNSGFYTRNRGDYSTFINRRDQFNLHNTPGSTDYRPGELSMAQVMAGLKGFYETSAYVVPTTGSVIAPAVIQAAGTVKVNATQEINNSVIRPNTTSINASASNRNTSAAVFASTVKPVITAQLPPDLAQRQVNPVALAGFSLPAGQNGLFRWSAQQPTADTGSHRSKLSVAGLEISSQRRVKALDYSGVKERGFSLESQPVSGSISGFGPLALNTNAQQVKRVQGLLEIAHLDNRHKYLIETNPVLTNLKQFMSSDYLLDKLRITPDNTHLRLGDGLYEQRLIRQAVVARTGQRYIDGIASDDALYRYLMDNAISYKDSLNLQIGVSLTAEQVAALTHDIVWMEEAQVNGQRVLTPVLYLAQADNRLAPNGALIQGQDVGLISGADLHNSGTLRATNHLNLLANNIDNSGLMQAGNRLEMRATNSISNSRGGVVAGRDINATALSGDIINERTVTTFKREGDGYQLRNDVVSDASRFEAINTLKLSAGRNAMSIGSTLKAGGNASIVAGRDVMIASQTEEDSYDYQRRRVKGTGQTILQHTSAVDVGGDLSIKARRDIAFIGSNVSAVNDLHVAAGESLTLAAAANEQHDYSKGKKGQTKTTTQSDQIIQQGAALNAGGDLIAIAGTNMTLLASKISAGNEAYIHAVTELSLLAAKDSNYSLYDMKEKGSWGSKKTQRDEITDIKNVVSEIKTDGDLTLSSGGDQRYQAAQLSSGNDIALISGGAITFKAVKDLHQESHEKSDDNAFWVSSKGKGNTDETLRQAKIIAEGNIAIKAVDGLKIDIKHIDQQNVSQSIDAMVKANPQLAWLKEAEKRGDVDWRQVKEIHEGFKYNNSGLGPASQIIIAIVMAAFVGPAAMSAMTVAGASAGVAAGAGAVAAGAATNAAVSAVNNRGNLGAVIKDVTSSDAMKGYVISGVTAGVTAGYFDDLTGTQTNTGTSKVNVSLNTWKGAGHFAANQTLQSGTSLALSKALGQGGNVSDALKNALFNTLAAASFNAVGDYTQGVFNDGSVQKLAIQAMVGGLLAEATGGDFKIGALAAGANEALAGHLYSLVKGDEALLTMSSQVLGVLAAAAQNDVSASKLENGKWIAQSLTQYNFLEHLPPGLVEYGQAATTLAEDMQKKGATNGEIAQGQLALAQGQGFDGVQPATEFVTAWGMFMAGELTGAGLAAVLGRLVSGGAKATGEAATQIPGRVQSRVNIANGRTETTPFRDNGNPVSAGFDHVLEGHFNREISNSRSVFTIAPDELKGILQSSSVVKSPVIALPDGQFLRTVDVGRAIGTTTLKDGGVPTSVIKVFTDKAGNLITTFPVKVGN